MQRAMRIAALDSFHGFEDVLESFQGRYTTQFIDKVLLRSRHDKPFADRTATLRGHGSHGDRSGELHSHHTPVEALIIEEQSILSGILASAGKTPAKPSTPGKGGGPAAPGPRDAPRPPPAAGGGGGRWSARASPASRPTSSP